jgi:hypothetical protein
MSSSVMLSAIKRFITICEGVTIDEEKLKKFINSFREKKKTPKSTDNFWIVRISPRKGAEAARFDYKKLVKDNQAGKKAVWDKDSKNRMIKGDWFGFIVGPIGNETVDLFYIESEGSTDLRPPHWHEKFSYTNQETLTAPETREIVVFKKQPIISMTWEDWKDRAGYKSGYMPRGTTRSKSPY